MKTDILDATFDIISEEPETNTAPIPVVTVEPQANTEPTANVVVVYENPPVSPGMINPDQEADYRLSRSTLRTIITKGTIAIDSITSLAKDLESPRAYEVLATMMKTVSETTKDLYDLQGKTKALRDENKKDPNPEGSITVEKAVFVGTSADMLKQLKNGNSQG